MTRLAGPSRGDLGGVGCRVERFARVGDVVSLFVIFADPNATGVRPETSLLVEDREVSEVEKETIEDEGFRALILEIDRENDVVLRPVGRIVDTASPGAKGVTDFACGAIAMPRLAEGIGGDAGELAERSFALPVHLDGGRNADVEERVTARGDGEGVVRPGNDGILGEPRSQLDQEIIFHAVPALPFEAAGEIGGPALSGEFVVFFALPAADTHSSWRWRTMRVSGPKLVRIHRPSGSSHSSQDNFKATD